jgi:hypothetical protein
MQQRDLSDAERRWIREGCHLGPRDRDRLGVVAKLSRGTVDRWYRGAKVRRRTAALILWAARRLKLRVPPELRALPRGRP